MTKNHWALLVTLIIAVPMLVLAQQEVRIIGTDSNSNMPAVLTDAQGRLIVSTGSGGSAVATVPFPCLAIANSHKVTSVGLVAVSVPSAVAGNRQFVRLCNSAENSGIPNVKCRNDGSDPVMGIANAGEVLSVGDCATYGGDAGVRCISDTAATAVTTYECQ